MPILQLPPASLARFLEEHPDAILVDVREAWEHALVHLPGSVHLPLGSLRHGAEDLLPDPSIPLVLYCHHGIRSLQGCAILQGLGYAELLNLAGGIERYSSEVDPRVDRY